MVWDINEIKIQYELKWGGCKAHRAQSDGPHPHPHPRPHPQEPPGALGGRQSHHGPPGPARSSQGPPGGRARRKGADNRA